MIPRILYLVPLYFSHYRNAWIYKYLILWGFFQILEYLHMQHKIFLGSKHKNYVHFTCTLHQKPEGNFVHKMKFHRILHLWYDIHLETSAFQSNYDSGFSFSFFFHWNIPSFTSIMPEIESAIIFQTITAGFFPLLIWDHW